MKAFQRLSSRQESNFFTVQCMKVPLTLMLPTAFGIAPEEAEARFEETLEIMTKAWTSRTRAGGRCDRTRNRGCGSGTEVPHRTERLR
ncbi:MAG: hypothetical protein WA005_00175 [Candidatus Binataceae bacterium]